MTILSYNKENKEHLFLFLKKYKYFILTFLTLVAKNVIKKKMKKLLNNKNYILFEIFYNFLCIFFLFPNYQTNH